MTNRDFSDSIKLAVIKKSLKENNGEIHCSICGLKLSSIEECHFDHIVPFAKEGKSSFENCQILCINCNLKKTDKALEDFVLEEKAKRFFVGEPIDDSIRESKDNYTSPDVMSKELFDQSVQSFIDQKGDIHKVDFSREYNHLPSIHYVKKYYGDLNTLKKKFGIEDLSLNWNRATIKVALERYIEQNGDLLQKDLTKKNKLPSLPCILNYYPEFNNFTEIKQHLCNLVVREKWDLETVICAGKEYVEKHGKITENLLRAENHLPTSKVIYSLFGSISAYQEAIGSAITSKNEYISEKDIKNAVEQYFGERERIVESMAKFFETFPYSTSTIHKRFGSYVSFCQTYGIIVLNSKKAKYTKQEVDDAISKWAEEGKEIPAAKNLCKLGLPSLSVILKYYEDWKEPFILYRKIYDKFKK